jgi:hypothetical protein
VSPKETSAEGAAQIDEIFSINLHPGQLDTAHCLEHQMAQEFR